jgi:hypothetical protein
VRVAHLNGVDHLVGQVPCALLSAVLGNDQIDYRAVAEVVSSAANDQGQGVLAMNGEVTEFVGLRDGRDCLCTPAINETL